MPRASGRPQEIILPGLTRGGPAATEAVVEKPSRPVRPVITKTVTEDDDVRKRGPGGVKITRPAPKVVDDSRQRTKISITNFDREAQQRSPR